MYFRLASRCSSCSRGNGRSCRLPHYSRECREEITIFEPHHPRVDPESSRFLAPCHIVPAITAAGVWGPGTPSTVLYMSCTSLNSTMSFCTAPAMSSSLRQRRHGKGKEVPTVWVGRAVRGMRLCCCTFYTRISRGQQWVRSRSACTVHLNWVKLNLSCHSGCASSHAGSTMSGTPSWRSRPSKPCRSTAQHSPSTHGTAQHLTTSQHNTTHRSTAQRDASQPCVTRTLTSSLSAQHTATHL